MCLFIITCIGCLESCQVLMRKGISKTSHKFTDWLPYLLACLSFPSIENIESHCSALFSWVLSEDSKLCISWNYVNCVPQNGSLLENHNVILNGSSPNHSSPNTAFGVIFYLWCVSRRPPRSDDHWNMMYLQNHLKVDGIFPTPIWKIMVRLDDLIQFVSICE